MGAGGGASAAQDANDSLAVAFVGAALVALVVALVDVDVDLRRVRLGGLRLVGLRLVGLIGLRLWVTHASHPARPDA